jgi:hypothetical protein
MCLSACYGLILDGYLLASFLRLLIHNNDARVFRPPLWRQRRRLFFGVVSFFFSPVSTIKYRIITFFLHPPHRPHGSPLLICERACVPLQFRNVEKNGGNHQTRATQICAAAIFPNELSSLAIC